MYFSAFRVSLRTRAILAVAGFGLLAFGVFFFLAASQQHHVLEEEVRHSYTVTARILADAMQGAVAERDTSTIARICTTAQQDSDIVALVIRDDQGQPIAQRVDSGLENLSPQHLPFAPTSQAQFFEFGDEPPGLFHQSGHLYVISAPINNAGSLVGWLQICILTKRLNQAFADSTFWGMRVLAVYFVLGALAIVFIDRRLRQSIKALIETVSAMTSGELSRKVQLKTGDAIESLGNQFNKMAEALHERNQQVQEYQHNLETMVAERTQAVRQERNKLRDILDHIPSGFLLLDKNLATVTASANYEKIFSRFGNHAIHTRCGHGLWPAKDCADCPSAQALQQDRVVSATFRLHPVDGEARYFEQTAIPIHRNGAMEGILEMITEVTERIATQEKLLKAERLAATGEIAALIAHEARNSLTSVKMILQMLRERSSKNAKSSHSMNVALDSVVHLEDFVNQLLQFARPAPLARRLSSLPDLLDQIVELMRHELTSRNIELVFDNTNELPKVNIDATRIKEAVINLLINAADGIDKNGKITIVLDCRLLQKEIRDQFVFLPHAFGETAESASQEVSEIVIPSSTEVICLAVEDTGPGIPTETVSQIFEPFFTTKTKGTGLGLPLVRRIAHEHGGTVLYRPASDRGACFEIILPMS